MDIHFYPLIHNTAQQFFFYVADPANPHLGKESISPSDFSVEFAAAGATVLTDISSDGGGTGTTIIEFRRGWYAYTCLASRTSTAGPAIFQFLCAGGVPTTVLAHVGARASAGRLAARVEQMADNVVTGSAIAAAALTAAKFADNAITASKVATDVAEEIAGTIFGTIMEDSTSFGNIIRGVTSILAGTVTDFQTGVLTFKSLNGLKTRWTILTGDSGRMSVTKGDLS